MFKVAHGKSIIDIPQKTGLASCPTIAMDQRLELEKNKD
jgi:hypothetical protein